MKVSDFIIMSFNGGMIETGGGDLQREYLYNEFLLIHQWT